MKKKSATKKRNPQDLTLRNLRALRKRVERLEQWCEAIVNDLHHLHADIQGNYKLNTRRKK